MGRPKKIPTAPTVDASTPVDEKPKRTVDPDSPMGIRMAWGTAEREYRKAKAKVVALTGERNAALHTEQAAAATLTKVAAKVKALLPPEPKVPGA